MYKWVLVKLENIGDTVSDINYRAPAIFTMIGRILGFALMFGGGFMIGQVVRAFINALLIRFGLM